MNNLIKTTSEMRPLKALITWITMALLSNALTYFLGESILVLTVAMILQIAGIIIFLNSISHWIKTRKKK